MISPTDGAFSKVTTWPKYPESRAVFPRIESINPGTWTFLGNADHAIGNRIR